MYPPRTRIITALGLALYAVFANAADIQVKMIDISKTEGLVAFEPTFVKANVNDTIVFTSTNPGHNSRSLLVPSGAQTWQSRFDKDFRVTLEKEGIYIYACDAHKDLGMIGVVQVGKAVNLEEAKIKAAEISSKMEMHEDRLIKALNQVQPAD